MGTALELVRFAELLLYGFQLMMARSASERHTLRQRRREAPFEYGNHYAWFLSIFSITMAYSLSCPLITPFGLLYAVMKHFVDR